MSKPDELQKGVAPVVENQRRYRAVAISNVLLLNMMTEGWRAGDGVVIECIDGLPEGAKLVRTFTDHMADTAVFVVEHPTFEPVPAGETMPYHTPRFRGTRE